MTGLHPWQWLRDHLPHVTVVSHPLPDDLAGGWDGDGRIIIDSRLTQAARRSVLTHELVHIARGSVPDDPVLMAREEAMVDEIAARALIGLDTLIDALRWCRGVPSADMADEVWTDRHALLVRLATLTPAERATVAEALADCDWAA